MDKSQLVGWVEDVADPNLPLRVVRTPGVAGGGEQIRVDLVLPGAPARITAEPMLLKSNIPAFCYSPDVNNDDYKLNGTANIVLRKFCNAEVSASPQYDMGQEGVRLSVMPPRLLRPSTVWWVRSLSSQVSSASFCTPSTALRMAFIWSDPR